MGLFQFLTSRNRHWSDDKISKTEAAGQKNQRVQDSHNGHVIPTAIELQAFKLQASGFKFNLNFDR
jgi:hypothetical protein